MEVYTRWKASMWGSHWKAGSPNPHRGPRPLTSIRQARPQLHAVKMGNSSTLESPKGSTTFIVPKALSDDDIYWMRVVDLQRELANLGLPKYGRKKELLERLKAAVQAQRDKEQQQQKQQEQEEKQEEGQREDDEERQEEEEEQEQGQQQQTPSDGSEVEYESSVKVRRSAISSTVSQVGAMTPRSANRAPVPAPAAASPSPAATDPLPQQQQQTPALAESAGDTADVTRKFASGTRGASWGLAQRHMKLEELQRLVHGNISGLMLSFFGTSSFACTADRSMASVALLRLKDVLIFDASDDIQRQLNHLSFVRPSKVYRIFVTSLSSETIAGLPGLLLTCIASRTRGHELSDIPIHIYGPPGLADFIYSVYQVSRSYIEVPIIINEFHFGPVEEGDRTPALMDTRSKTYTISWAPDQLNPSGCVSGDLSTFKPTEGRASVRRGARASGGVMGTDSRAEFLPFDVNELGDPSREDVSIPEMKWTIDIDAEARIVAVALPGPRPTLGYVVQEAKRAGQLMVDRCMELGVTPGFRYGKLKGGESVEIGDGRIIHPEDVLSPTRPGRIVAILGSCGQGIEGATALRSAAQDADVIVYGTLQPEASGPPKEPCVRTTATEAGRLAASLGARHVLLSRFDSRCHPYRHDVDPRVQELTEEVAEAFPGGQVSAVHDFWTHILEKHDGPIDPPPQPRVVWSGVDRQEHKRDN